ncbi:uncharacterized protein LOC112690445 isoform X2 [Sipha flava]|nr:uncharacterized protein LOC112690445 isoform X2 [Sipha flava]
MKDPTFKKLIIVEHSDVLLAGLCQLCLLPIAKPGTKIAKESAIDELKYEQLIKEQNTFKNILIEKILLDKDPFFIREVIFVIGLKKIQKHLKLGLEELFSDLLIHDDGIQTFLRIACDHVAETSQNLDGIGLHEWSNLIHSYYTKSNLKYKKYIVPQIWNLLRSNAKVHQYKFRSIGVFCVHLMFSENYNDFLEYYLNPIEQLIKRSRLQMTEIFAELSTSIEDLYTLFYQFRDAMWSLNPKLLVNVAPTIYNLYTATASGVYHLKSKLEDLVFLILTNFSDSKDHLKLIIFSRYLIDAIYDDDGNISIKCTHNEHQLNLESQVNVVIDLIDRRFDLKSMKFMFVTLLDMYIDTASDEYTIMEKLFIIKAIIHLIEKNDVQNSISKDPENVLNLIKSLLQNIHEDNSVDFEFLTIIIMVLGSVLENIDQTFIYQLDFFSDYLPKLSENIDDTVLKDMLLEICQKIKRIKNSCIKEPISDQRTIDDVLNDTRDPLLPCRAHALMELKKMIESGDETVLAKKSIILIVIQENLKNVDSYIYLSAIFTLSSLCSYYPDDIMPILCEVYVNPTICHHSSETRLKIGEVLMKTVKFLNETIPWHKNRLINTFMAGVRDEDHLLRASSLSNLADVCRLLRYKLGSIVAEIVKCVDYVLNFDLAVEPRRAAVLLFQMIIEGCSLELLEICEGSIKDIYHILKHQYQCSKDETTKLHAQIAIERLNDVMKALFLNDKNILK